MPAWPANFPELFATEGFALEPISNSTVIDVESGEPLSRLRFTGAMDEIAGSLTPVSRAVAEDILDFWRDDLAHGTLRFTWEHPLSLEALEFLFMEPPKFSLISGMNWRVSVRLRTMPP